MNNTISYKRSQLPANALYVGIDPHKRKHAISIQTEKNQVVEKFMISSNHQGFAELLRRCEQVRKQTDAQQLVFAIEPGAHYWRNLAYFLDEHQQMVRLINPFTLKRQRDGEDLTRRKNDYRDAAMAAQLAAEGKYTWTSLSKERYAELRYTHETYQQTVEDETRTRLQLQCVLDELFPEFQQVFADLSGITALHLLQTMDLTPRRIAQLSVTDWLHQASAGFQGKRLMRKKLVRLHEVAQLSVGVPHGTQAMLARVHLLAKRLSQLGQQRQEAETAFVELFRQFPESRFLLSIRGLGPINAAGLLAHVGDIQQYSSVKQLPKLAGIVPIESSSAGHTASLTPMSKKGRRGLRTVAFRAIASLLRHNEGFRQYLAKLQNRPAGKNPLVRREAMGAAMNKLLRIVYSLLTKQQLFDPSLAFAA